MDTANVSNPAWTWCTTQRRLQQEPDAPSAFTNKSAWEMYMCPLGWSWDWKHSVIDCFDSFDFREKILFNLGRRFRLLKQMGIDLIDRCWQTNQSQCSELYCFAVCCLSLFKVSHPQGHSDPCCPEICWKTKNKCSLIPPLIWQRETENSLAVAIEFCCRGSGSMCSRQDWKRKRLGSKKSVTKIYYFF